MNNTNNLIINLVKFVFLISILVKRYCNFQDMISGIPNGWGLLTLKILGLINWAVLSRPGNDKLMPHLNGDIFNCASAGYLFIKFPVYAISGGSSNE